jgi:hypothetical protein
MTVDPTHQSKETRQGLHPAASAVEVLARA